MSADATRTSSSGAGELSGDAITSLRQSLRGNVVTLDDGAAYDKAREIWNKMYQERKPKLIVQPLGNTDVAKAMRFATEHSLEVAVKGGGHSAQGHALVDGGMVIDLALMRGVIVDPVAKSATIQGGALLGDIDEEMGVYNVMFPLGHYRRTGMGLILGGGLGVAARRYGVASEHLTSVTLVTAEGEVVTCSKEQEEDLFWACHGAAANFGVVTSVTVRLHDVPKSYYGGLLIVPGAHYVELAKFMFEVGSTDPDFCMVAAQGMHPEAGPIVVCMIHHFGPQSPEEKAHFLAPLRALGPIADTVGQMTYAQTQDCLTGPMDAMPPVNVYWVSNRLQSLPTEEFFKTYHDLHSEVTPELAPSLLILDLQGGAGFEEPAYGPLYVSKEPTVASWYAVVCWPDAKENEKGVAYAKKLKATLAPFSGPQEYANMTSASGAQEAHMVGGTESLARLKAVKQRWDPTNVFRSNHNIPLDD